MSPPLDHFIPNRDAPALDLLGSFLQSPPTTVAEKYIAAFTAPGDLIIDPFACRPNLARVALKMGRRAILFESHPLWAWLARALATVPGAAEINASLTRWGDAVKDDTPLRAHIAQLYATRCVECNQLTPADYFIHQRDEGPIRRHYTCTNCGATRDDPATPDDIERSKSFAAKGMHYHLAFERVAPEENLHASRIRKMLDLYTPRSLYALVTLTVKGDTLFRAQPERQVLNLLLLHLLDRGTALYASPDQPAQLTRHRQFVEFNLWREMELAAQALGKLPALELADSPGAVADAQAPCTWIGRAIARRFAEEGPALTGALVLTAPPPRRIAIWALGYFWGAWILKRATVEKLAPFLDPQTNDPTWERQRYYQAMGSAMTSLAKILHPDAHMAFVFDESSYETIEALVLTASAANMNLENLIFQPRLGDSPRREFDHLRGSYRVSFTHLPSPSAGESRLQTGEKSSAGELKKQIHTAALQAGREILTRRGEPLGFPWLHHAAYARAARDGLLRRVMRAELKSAPGRLVFQAVQDGLTEGYAHDFDHYAGQGQYLWFRRAQSDTPLIDRVEQAVRAILTRGNVSREPLEDEIYQKFSGDLTPEDGLIELCLRAFTQENFAAEKTRVAEMIGHLGERLGYAVARDVKPFDWAWKESGEIAHGFVWRERAAFADLARIHIAPARGSLIVAESQVELLREKVRRLPPLVDAYREAGWDFVRVSSLEKLLKKEKIERSDLVLMPGLVPLVAEPSAQLELFEITEDRDQKIDNKNPKADFGGAEFS